MTEIKRRYELEVKEKEYSNWEHLYNSPTFEGINSLKSSYLRKVDDLGLSVYAIRRKVIVTNIIEDEYADN